MGMLSRSEMLKQQPLKIVKVELDKENFVYVREMTGRERDLFEASLLKSVQLSNGDTKLEQDMSDFRAKLAVCTVCDESGKLLFSPNDYKTLSANMKASWLTKIATAAQELNALEEKQQAELRKNSGSSPAEDSLSGSA